MAATTTSRAPRSGFLWLSLALLLLLQQQWSCTLMTNAFVLVGKQSGLTSGRVLKPSPLLHHHHAEFEMDDTTTTTLTVQTTTITTSSKSKSPSSSLNRRNWLGLVLSTSLIVNTATIALAADDDNDDSSPSSSSSSYPPNLPLITVKELETLFRTAAKSVRVVEFSGPRSETVVVQLVDGVTRFGLSDVIESPTDPRSPLRVAAICREFKVPTKFLSIEAILAKSSSSSSGFTTKKKLYTNDRVREAQVKEKEKKERMEQDEAERLVELYQYQQKLDI